MLLFISAFLCMMLIYIYDLIFICSGSVYGVGKQTFLSMVICRIWIPTDYSGGFRFKQYPDQNWWSCWGQLVYCSIASTSLQLFHHCQRKRSHWLQGDCIQTRLCLFGKPSKYSVKLWCWRRCVCITVTCRGLGQGAFHPISAWTQSA